MRHVIEVHCPRCGPTRPFRTHVYDDQDPQHVRWGTLESWRHGIMVEHALATDGRPDTGRDADCYGCGCYWDIHATANQQALEAREVSRPLVSSLDTQTAGRGATVELHGDFLDVGELRVALQHQDGEVVAAEVMSRSRTTASIRVPFSAALGRHDVRAFSQFGAFRDRYGPVDLVGRQTLAGALVVTA